MTEILRERALVLGGRTWRVTPEEKSALDAWVENWMKQTKDDGGYQHTSSNVRAISFALGLADFAARNWTCDPCRKTGKNLPCGCGRIPDPDDPDPWPGEGQGEGQKIAERSSTLHPCCEDNEHPWAKKRP